MKVKVKVPEAQMKKLIKPLGDEITISEKSSGSGSRIVTMLTLYKSDMRELRDFLGKIAVLSTKTYHLIIRMLEQFYRTSQGINQKRFYLDAIYQISNHFEASQSSHKNKAIPTFQELVDVINSGLSLPNKAFVAAFYFLNRDKVIKQSSSLYYSLWELVNKITINMTYVKKTKVLGDKTDLSSVNLENSENSILRFILVVFKDRFPDTSKEELVDLYKEFEYLEKRTGNLPSNNLVKRISKLAAHVDKQRKARTQKPTRSRQLAGNNQVSRVASLAAQDAPDGVTPAVLVQSSYLSNQTPLDRLAKLSLQLEPSSPQEVAAVDALLSFNIKSKSTGTAARP